MERKGIDVSKHQGNIDWQKVKNAGVEFAMLRATYGTSSVDLQFRKNAEECTRFDIPFGAYVYSYARNLNEAKDEVQLFIDTIKPYKLSYPAVIDMEDSDGYKEKNGVSYSTCNDICEYECLELEKAGYWATVYANLDWLTNKINSSKLDRFDKWLAQWGSKPTYSKSFGLWQYASHGIIEGISGNVDLNVAYVDYPSWYENKTLTTETPEPQTKVYTVVKGDSLWAIAQKQMGDGTKWKQIYDLNGLKSETIFPGQFLKIPV